MQEGSRIKNGLEKSHCVDARVITGASLAKPADIWHVQKMPRKRNRQIHKATIGKGGYRKLNQAPKYVQGFQLFDKAKTADGREGFVFGRRVSGQFEVRKLSGEKISSSINYKKLRLLSKRKTVLTEIGGKRA